MLTGVVLTWLLITSGDQGNYQVIERFKDKAQCEFVQKALPNANWYQNARCIQAEIMVVK